MRVLSTVLLSVVCLSILGGEATSGDRTKPAIQAPMAKVVPHKLTKHGDVRVDNYYWLKQRENSETIDYLNAENAYTKAMTEHIEDLQKTLFDEIKGRIKQTDESVPYRKEGYFYYSRFEDGKQYRVHCRKKGSLTAVEHVMLDANELADGHNYFAVGGLRVSTNNVLLAYAEDTQGRRFYTIHIKNLDTGEVLNDTIQNSIQRRCGGTESIAMSWATTQPTTSSSSKKRMTPFRPSCSRPSRTSMS